jgi:hypothetical protein
MPKNAFFAFARKKRFGSAPMHDRTSAGQRKGKAREQKGNHKAHRGKKKERKKKSNIFGPQRASVQNNM